MHWRTLYVKARRHLPEKILEVLESFAVHPFLLSERLKVHRAVASGPRYRPSHQAIIIDITTLCNRFCMDCNRSVGQEQAMTGEHMSVAQIDRFIDESIAKQRRWERIDIEGGEPALHPDIFEILDHLLRYRDKHSPRTNIRVLTNGYGDKVKKVIAQLPGLGVDVYNSRKTSIFQDSHVAFNIAPGDLEECQGEDFSQGCYLPAAYGLGLTRHGYYPHPVCGGIDRVFGLNVGRKRLPDAGDPMTEQFENLCKSCGFYLYSKQLQAGRKRLATPAGDRGRRTQSWTQAYSQYWKKKPVLTSY